MGKKIKGAVGPLSALLMLIMALPTFAATTSELEAELAAQIEINKLLKVRVRELEAEVSALRAGSVTSDQLAYEPPPEDAADLDESDGALEEALVRRGSAVLPPWKKQIIPSLSWSHSGSGAFSADTVTAGIAGRIGLPGGWMVGASVPYVAHAQNPMGDNNGFGSVSARVWKQIVAQGQHRPSVVAQLTYSAPTGENVFETPVATGSAFHSITGRLALAKKVDPVAFFGDAFYTYAFEKNVGGMDRRPGDVFGFTAGASLAATPRISLQASVGVAFAGENRQNGMSLAGTDRTIGTVGIGAGFVVTEGKYLSINGNFGVTDDAPDFTLGASMPMRF